MPYTKNNTCLFCEKSYIAYNWRSQVCSHECHLARRRAWQTKNGERLRQQDRYRYHHGGKAYYKKYERTVDGLLMRKYRNMKSRVLGIQSIKAHLYKGKELLNKESFYKWAKESKDFHKLYKKWVESNYERKLSPSIDRINSSKGYTLGNMRWLTHSENSRLGSISNHNRRYSLNSTEK